MHGHAGHFSHRHVPRWKSYLVRLVAAGSCAIILVFAVAFATDADIRAELGRGTWNMLHRLAAQFPESPTEEDRARHTAFFDTFAKLYPCKVCSKHFQEMMARTPPRLESRESLSMWLCERHNEVNKRLGKVHIMCEPKALQDKYGDCGCEEDGEGAEGSGARADSGDARSTGAGPRPGTVVGAAGAAPGSR